MARSKAVKVKRAAQHASFHRRTASKENALDEARSAVSHSIARHNWFRLPLVSEWRHRLLQQYKSRTREYVLVKRPDIAWPENESLMRNARDAILRIGRAGLRLEAIDQPSLRIRRTQRRIERRRAPFLDALDRILSRRSFRLVTVGEVLKEAHRSRYAFYSAFHSGLHGLYCSWVIAELDRLTRQTQRQIVEALRTRKSPQKILSEWADLVLKFVVEKPYGRIPINGFVTHEIDSIGCALLEHRGTVPENSEWYRQRDVALAEFADLAAECHRAGARLIYQLQQVFRVRRFALHPQAASVQHRWRRYGRDFVAWHMAASFWQMAFTSLNSLGFLEAERVSEEHRTLIVDAWLRGVASSGH